MRTGDSAAESPVCFQLQRHLRLLIISRVAVCAHDLHVVVQCHTGTGRNQLTDDDILLQTEQIVALAVDRGIGQSLSVSWKDAADMKLSEDEEALVIPSSDGLVVTRRRSVSPASMRA